MVFCPGWSWGRCQDDRSWWGLDVNQWKGRCVGEIRPRAGLDSAPLPSLSSPPTPSLAATSPSLVIPSPRVLGGLAGATSGIVSGGESLLAADLTAGAASRGLSGAAQAGGVGVGAVVVNPSSGDGPSLPPASSAPPPSAPSGSGPVVVSSSARDSASSLAENVSSSEGLVLSTGVSASTAGLVLEPSLDFSSGEGPSEGTALPSLPIADSGNEEGSIVGPSDLPDPESLDVDGFCGWAAVESQPAVSSSLGQGGGLGVSGVGRAADRRSPPARQSVVAGAGHSATGGHGGGVFAVPAVELGVLVVRVIRVDLLRIGGVAVRLRQLWVTRLAVHVPFALSPTCSMASPLRLTRASRLLQRRLVLLSLVRLTGMALSPPDHPTHPPARFGSTLSLTSCVFVRSSTIPSPSIQVPSPGSPASRLFVCLRHWCVIGMVAVLVGAMVGVVLRVVWVPLTLRGMMGRLRVPGSTLRPLQEMPLPVSVLVASRPVLMRVLELLTNSTLRLLEKVPLPVMVLVALRCVLRRLPNSMRLLEEEMPPPTLVLVGPRPVLMRV
ncbi:unnamed protein product [Vitrella brassicaformis CCMP3155]|uniref:Uncharacterized protein n=1 Tax=Vitrella brassicaformis (strain CCMP3155) TaxID=1169540 RepID=A0A0G4E9I0_VITBC|nr:unnamed protein product [Vitrella brassicaformis CCMP3155]|eukprot:CEL92043.1 unnamed protein product [Vitrella brassicaformis CCMP3155]